MRNEKDVEAYLLRSNRRFKQLDETPGTFLVDTTDGMPALALRVQAPLVVLRVHSAYGIEGDVIVLASALELENLDFNELQAALDEIDMALTQQVPMLAELKKGDKK
jgi:hypothetical protein